jgi:hypothetical protein
MADALDFDPDIDPFPLDAWFNLSLPITDQDVQSAVDAMTHQAARLGDPALAPRLRWSVRRLKLAVQAHNAQFPRST